MILARVGDKKQNKTLNMAEFVEISLEIQCVIFQQNYVNPYGIYNNYIELGIDFYNMINFFRK